MSAANPIALEPSTRIVGIPQRFAEVERCFATRCATRLGERAMAEPMAQDSLPDEELIVRIGSGQIEALQTLVYRYQDQIWRLACHLLRDPHGADDLTQDVFLRVYHAAGSFKPKARVSTWIYQITLNLCRDRLRHHKRQPRSIGPFQLELTGDLSTDSLVRKEMIEAIRDAVDELPKRQRAIVILHRFENLTHEQIVEVTGWSRSAVESLLVRAYARLRKTLAGFR